MVTTHFLGYKVTTHFVSNLTIVYIVGDFSSSVLLGFHLGLDWFDFHVDSISVKVFFPFFFSLSIWFAAISCNQDLRLVTILSATISKLGCQESLK